MLQPDRAGLKRGSSWQECHRIRRPQSRAYGATKDWSKSKDILGLPKTIGRVSLTKREPTFRIPVSGESYNVQAGWAKAIPDIPGHIRWRFRSGVR